MTFYKKEFRRLQKSNIELYNRKCVLNLENVEHLNRNNFWKKVKQHKRKKQAIDMPKNLNLEKFSQFYSKLFKNDCHQNSVEQQEIIDKVKRKIDETKDVVYNSNFTMVDVKTITDELKNNVPYMTV